MMREIRDEEVKIPILSSPTPTTVELLLHLLHLIHLLSAISDEYSACIVFTCMERSQQTTLKYKGS